MNGSGKKRGRRISLRREIILLISCVVIGAIFLCWILNFAVLERYYQADKQKTLVNIYEQLSAAAVDGSLYKDDYRDEFDNLTIGANLDVTILNSDYSIVRSTANDMMQAISDFKDILYSDYYAENDSTHTHLIREADTYQIMQSKDRRLRGEYLYLTGNLQSDNGELVLIRTPLESIRESVQIANRFLGIVAVLSIIVAIIAGCLLTRRITGPIAVLTEISKRMVNLDFEAKYTKDAWRKKEWRRQTRRNRQADEDSMLPEGIAEGNEIDQLGACINLLSEHLEGTIAELKSANAELQTDIKRKIEIDEMRKEFLSNVSHELKTPLALIQGYAEGLKDEVNEDPESREYYCDVIIDEAAKMNRMVKKLLTLNQIEFGNEQLDMSRFDMTELIRGVANATKILRDQKEISLETDIEEGCYVWGDEFKVEEVLTNYMSNAINHCSGEKQIRIFYTARPDDLLRISVFNTGHQIPEEDLDKIWVKFYKVDKAHTRAYGGSGIGLSIVRAIMDSMHQECGVINHETGVEFWLELSRK